jgi:hypothetical protein
MIGKYLGRVTRTRLLKGGSQAKPSTARRTAKRAKVSRHVVVAQPNRRPVTFVQALQVSDIIRLL